MSDRYHRHVAVPRSKAAATTSTTARRGADALPPLPPKPAELSWRDYLVFLLHIAAELEHSLMVQYLYAAYSLGGADSDDHATQVREWRDIILTIAREEMGHLLTVQNALLLVGGAVRFDRDDFPWSSPFYPFEFRLEPFSLASLARYVYAEMPKDLTRRADLAVQRDVLRIVQPGLAPTVGEVYERVMQLIADRRLIPDEVFDAESYRYQATWDEWGRNYRPLTHQPYAKDPVVPPPHARKTRVIVAQMATRTEALAGLQDIAGQGEAEHVRPGDKMEDSHFDRFAKIFRAYQTILKKEPRWSPSRPVPTNPFAGTALEAPEHATPITSPTSRSWAALFDLRYRMLLTLITYLFEVPRRAVDAGQDERASVLARIFGEMYNLKAIAGVLVRLPLGDPADPSRAGPPFQMPYSLTLPFPQVTFWRMQLELLSASSALVKDLLGDQRTRATPVDGARYLRALRDIDRDARVTIEAIIGRTGLDRRTRA